MRRWTIGALLTGIAALVMVAAPQATRADERNFTLINASPSVVITHVYVSAATTNDWEEDILGRDVLDPGDSVDILFSRYDGEGGQCLYDIKVVGDGGQEGVLYNVNLCTTETVTFR
jgi:hypothetical protein